MATAIESTFYHDEGMASKSSAVNSLKRKMTLDLSSKNTNKQMKFRHLLNSDNPTLLGSPDMNMLKLASPELEKFIIQQNGLVTTTPTPTQFICPKFVSEEQEAYAKGFVDALNELHRAETGPTGPTTVPSNLTRDLTYTTLTTVPSRSMIPTATTSLPGSVIPHVSQSLPIPAGQSITESFVIPRKLVVNVKEEPQTVPCFTSSPPLSPIDMGQQETAKLERKRARNRVAARKCRTRKLERISRLEIRVSEIKDHNTQLQDTAAKLRDQVFRLKQQIMDHVNSGCQVMLSTNLL